jgi:hypothetical protein
MAAAVRGDGGLDRRHFARLPVADRRSTVRARVRPGREVRLIDLSRGGALVQATSRLLPGSQVELQVDVGPWHWRTTGLVTRSQVWALRVDDHVRYRAAVQFAHPMDGAAQCHIENELSRDVGGEDECGYQMPVAGSLDSS